MLWYLQLFCVCVCLCVSWRITIVSMPIHHDNSPFIWSSELPNSETGLNLKGGPSKHFTLQNLRKNDTKLLWRIPPCNPRPNKEAATKHSGFYILQCMISCGHQVSSNQNPLPFHYTGWFTGILIMAYYNSFVTIRLLIQKSDDQKWSIFWTKI